MNNEQELEQMKEVYDQAILLARGTVGSLNKGEADWYCSHLQNGGICYKKEAVKEAFEKMKEIAFDLSRDVGIEY